MMSDPADQSGRPFRTGLQVAAALWAFDSLIYALLFLHLYRPTMTAASAVVGAIVDAASLTGLWLAGLVVVVRFPLAGTRWKRHALILALVAVAIVPLRIVLLWLLLPEGWFSNTDWVLILMRYYPPNLELFVLGVAAAHLIALQERLHTTETRAAEAKMYLSRARLAALRAELQPHFLFNALNSVSSLMYSYPRVAGRLLDQVSGLLRLSNLHADSETVPVQVELDFARRYLAIQQVRLITPLTVEWNVDPAAENVSVPYLILQPLVENAVHHAIAVRDGGTQLTIEVAVSGEVIQISVQDDGPGLSPSWREGIGLQNTRIRVHTLYGAAGSLIVDSKPGTGVRATITIPQRHNAEASPVGGVEMVAHG